MHKEIFSQEQAKMFPLLKSFADDFFLVGGTAIALQLGHRQSIDFDLASGKEIDAMEIRSKLKKIGKIEMVLRNTKEEFTVIINGIKWTFFCYPFAVRPLKKIDGAIRTPDLLALAAMKAYALGRRAKWKDYVDLYFIARKYKSINPIIKKAKQIFKNEFNEKSFRAQLSYFKDVDYSEEVFFLKGEKISDKEIKEGLTDLC